MWFLETLWKLLLKADSVAHVNNVIIFIKISSIQQLIIAPLCFSFTHFRNLLRFFTENSHFSHSNFFLYDCSSAYLLWTLLWSRSPKPSSSQEQQTLDITVAFNKGNLSHSPSASTTLSHLGCCFVTSSLSDTWPLPKPLLFFSFYIFYLLNVHLLQWLQIICLTLPISLFCAPISKAWWISQCPLQFA